MLHVRRYHTEHLFTGFMGEPRGQLNTWAKSFELESVPITRNLPGECTAVFSLFLVASGRMEPHQTWAKFKKNNCLPVALIPGKVSSSSSFERSHLSYACEKRYFKFFNSKNLTPSREDWRKIIYKITLNACLIPPLSAIFSPCVLTPSICISTSVTV